MRKIILTAGPSITKKEIDYVLDAVKNGWNNNAYSFTFKFAKKFSKYTGAKYAIATSGGTWALHLAFLAIGLKKGDEVIVPDLCYFSPLDVLVAMGVKPVFVDILENTWCIDPDDIKKKITKKTKAIMPVYMYGNLTEALKIKEIAQRHGLKVIDDSCPAVGSFYNNKHAGFFADFAAFSFQGAKILTTGLGGMLITNNKKLFERAWFLNHQGQKGPKFWQMEHAVCYDMSDLNASLGLAQLERVDELVEKKQIIFKWYHDRLSDIDGLGMNFEQPKACSNKWMSSIVLTRDFGITRDELREKLKKDGIDTRPFFFPASMFPMYEQAKTPISHKVGLNGINLPSGHNLSEEQIDFICRKLKKYL